MSSPRLYPEFSQAAWAGSGLLRSLPGEAGRKRVPYPSFDKSWRVLGSDEGATPDEEKEMKPPKTKYDVYRLVAEQPGATFVQIWVGPGQGYYLSTPDDAFIPVSRTLAEAVLGDRARCAVRMQVAEDSSRVYTITLKPNALEPRRTRGSKEER